MKTPICDFVRNYAASAPLRLHMPGHKGARFLGAEPLDITEVSGADVLYAAQGVIAESQRLAAGIVRQRGNAVFLRRGVARRPRDAVSGTAGRGGRGRASARAGRAGTRTARS